MFAHSPIAYCTHSLYLDIDGTLADIADTPCTAQVPLPTVSDVQRLHTLLEGALAIISGRPIAEIDAIMAPVNLPVAGVHGVQRRTAQGEWKATEPHGLHMLVAEATVLVGTLTGVRVESKPGAVALHYRAAPEHEGACLQAAQALAATHTGWNVMAGKCVVELKPQGVDKGSAVRAFQTETPFAGRRPIFVGDDVTDEAGFAVVAQLGGISVKVGDGPTAAFHRLPSPAGVRQWLSMWADGTPCLEALKLTKGACT